MIADQKAVKSVSLFGYSLILCKKENKTAGEAYADIVIHNSSVSVDFFKPMDLKAQVFTVAVKELIARDIQTFMSIDENQFTSAMSKIKKNSEDGDPYPHIEPVFGVFDHDDDKKEIMYG